MTQKEARWPVSLRSLTKRCRKNHGFTIIELMIVLVIAAVLLTIVAPSMASFFDTQRLKAAAEQIYSDLRVARSEAIARKQPVQVKFSVDGTDATVWRYAVSTVDDCDLSLDDPTDPNDPCILVIDDGDLIVHGLDADGDGVADTDTDDLVLQVRTSSDHGTITLTLENFDDTTSYEITFDPLNGTAVGNKGNILLTSPMGKQARLQVSNLGQLRLCSPDDSVVGYGDC